MYKAEFKYNNLKDKLKLNGNYKVEGPILALKSEIEKLKATFTKTNYFGPGKAGNRSRGIPYWKKTPLKDEKLYK